MAAKSTDRRERERSSRTKVRRGRAHGAVSVWKVSWTDRDGKRHRTYYATLQEAVAAASSKSGSITRQWACPGCEPDVVRDMTIRSSGPSRS